MKIIECSFLPPSGFKAMNLFGLIIHRSDTSEMSDINLNHEAIHTAQMKELLYIFFYIIYGIEWLYHLVRLRDCNSAYRVISFEREAYLNEDDLDYLSYRSHYAQWK